MMNSVQRSAANKQQLAVWQTEASALCLAVRWLPFWRPRVVLKFGRGSPWFWPFLWLAKGGAFNLLFLVIVSDDLLFCSAERRRSILAHECGHLNHFHSVIWTVALVFLLKNEWFHAGFIWVGRHLGPIWGLGLLLIFIGVSVWGLYALLYWFEHQADDYAVARVGAIEFVEALSWLNETMFGVKRSSWIDARIRRLNRIHGIRHGSDDRLNGIAI